jgi:hypothetical protein
MPGEAETCKIIIDKLTHATEIKINNLMHSNNSMFMHEEVNTSIDQPDNRSSFRLASYDTVTSRAKPSSHGHSSTVHEVLGDLLCHIGRRLGTVWAGKLR